MLKEKAFVPPSKLDEWLKYRLVPPPLYIRYLVAKAMRKGEAELKLIPVLADPARVSVDVGANKGVYSFLLARYSRSVVAVEPNPKIRAVLAAWARPPVTVLPYALSNQSGTAELRVPRSHKGFSNQGASLSAVKVSGDHAIVPVEAKRLDDLGLEPTGFLKIDVEGFEREVLEGGRATILRDRPRLLIEMEERHTRRPIEEDIAFVEALGYRGFFLRGGHVLSSLSTFDPERHHRAAARTGDREAYAFNFIFLPT